MHRSDRMTTPSRRRSPDFDVSATLLGLVDRVARLETTALHGTDMIRMALKRTDQAHGRIDLTDARVDRQAAEISGMAGGARAREMAAQHRQEMRRDALKGMGLLVTVVTLIGVLLGKLPADSLKWVTSVGVYVK